MFELLILFSIGVFASRYLINSYKATAFKICRRVRLSELIGLKKPIWFRSENSSTRFVESRVLSSQSECFVRLLIANLNVLSDELLNYASSSKVRPFTLVSVHQTMHKSFA